MSLAGDSTQFPQPSCETVDLDHPLQEDFVSRSTFSASPEEPNIGWEDCWRSALEGRIEGAEVTWTGEGTWTPHTVCFDWDKETNRVFLCTFPPGTGLSWGESQSGSCEVYPGLECPETEALN